jgi:hypothetical protein
MLDLEKIGDGSSKLLCKWHVLAIDGEILRIMVMTYVVRP